MKFSDVKIGQTFEYQGQTYTKESPMLASNGHGATKRMFRLSMEVGTSTISSAAVSSPKELAPLPVEQVRQALQQLQQLLQADIVQLQPALDNRQTEQLQGMFEKNLNWCAQQLGFDFQETL